MRGRSQAWRFLSTLVVGDRVPSELYVLDHRDGARPRWTVHELEEFPGGGRRLVLVDPDTGADSLFDDGRRVALAVLTWPSKTLRSQPYMVDQVPGPALCDLDQQGRHVARLAVPALARVG